MRYLINYANDAYRQAQKINTWTGKKIAKFDYVMEYSATDIDAEFYKEHENILSRTRGNGLWLWKPYFILKTLERVNENDIVFYCDAGACFFKSAKAVFQILEEEDIWVSVLPLVEKQFTKKYTFEAMECLEASFMETSQISGTFIAFRKNEKTIAFVKEWLSYCCDETILSPENQGEEEDYFIAHREDQSVLSLLVKKKQITFYQDPSQYGKLPEKYRRPNCVMNYYEKKDYKPFIIHHRTKNGKASIVIRQWMCAVLPRKIGKLLIAK